MHKRKAFTILEFLIVTCVVFVMIALLAPFVQMTKARATKIYCANNLRQISLGLHKYARDHNNAFPGSLGELYPDYLSDQGAFDCPASKNLGTGVAPDYVYKPGLTEASPSGTVIVQDKDENHEKAGKNIARVNGSVEWVSAK